MEDSYQAVECFGKTNKKGYYAVYDGHGGHLAADYTADYLHKYVTNGPLDADPMQTLKDAFRMVDQGWLAIANKHFLDDGTTVVVALVCDGTLYVANVGDSRCIISSGGKAVEMSKDHKPCREDEKKRIMDLGGTVVKVGAWRVEGILAVSRAIGDRRLKKYVTSDPEILVRQLGPSDDRLILATDGVWDVISNQQAADIVSRCSDVKLAAKALTDAAYNAHSTDNITSLVIDLSPYRC